MNVPPALRVWFIVHFAVDYFFAILLFFFPVQFLGAVGWVPIDIFAVRLVAAAFFAIGGASFLYRNADIDTFRTLLTLKIIWSLTAHAGMVYSVLQNAAPPFSSIILLLFALFGGTWVYYKIKLSAEPLTQTLWPK